MGLQERLNLQYTEKFNVKKAALIAFAVLCLNVGIILVIKSTRISNIIGAVCLVLFVRLIVGSPVEEVLTDASSRKLNKWLHIQTEEDDESEDDEEDDESE